MEKCFKCGSKIAEKNLHNLEDITEEDVLAHWFVKCPKCAFSGPIYISKSDALWGWDHMCRLFRQQNPAHKPTNKEIKST